MTDRGTRDETGELLEFAIQIAHEAGALTLRHFGGLVDHRAKEDGSPVTVADREAEELLRRRVGERFPGHAILGEEMGASSEDARVRWILDPIDATRSFMRGVPLYGVLIGIEIEGLPSVGVCHFPPLQETVAAGLGLGCSWNGAPCHVSGVQRIEDALILTTDLESILSREEGEGWRRLQRRAALARTWGDCYGHALVATGRAEVMVDPIVQPWDAAPFLTILTEAGGRFTTREGEATIHGGSGVSTNGVLHDEVLKELSGGGAGSGS
jgi:histidinol phosphatase-like enzyme (inositol monophosphatase family)